MLCEQPQVRLNEMPARNTSGEMYDAPPDRFRGCLSAVLYFQFLQDGLHVVRDRIKGKIER